MRGGQAEWDPRTEGVRAAQDTAHSAVQGDTCCCAGPQNCSQRESSADFPGQEPGLGWQHTHRMGKFLPQGGWRGEGRLLGTLPWGYPQFAAVRHGTTRLTHAAWEKLRRSPTCPSRLPAQAMHDPQCCITVPPLPLCPIPCPAPGSSPCTRQLLGRGTSVSTWPTFSRASASHHPPGWGAGQGHREREHQ